jgi:hypothetical protein
MQRRKMDFEEYLEILACIELKSPSIKKVSLESIKIALRLR